MIDPLEELAVTFAETKKRDVRVFHIGTGTFSRDVLSSSAFYPIRSPGRTNTIDVLLSLHNTLHNQHHRTRNTWQHDTCYTPTPHTLSQSLSSLKPLTHSGQLYIGLRSGGGVDEFLKDGDIG